MIRYVFFCTTAFLAGAGLTYAALGQRYAQTNLSGEKINYDIIAKTEHWDVLVREESSGRSVALGQSGQVRVVVLDDGPSLYILTYREDKPLWEGRLIDLGNDGSVDVANITGQQCEAQR